MKKKNFEKEKKINFVKYIFSKRLEVLIFFVTSKCNSRCPGCFYWENLNQNQDLTLSEIKKISQNMPKFKHILFSGGEPFLREDLPEICNIFRRNNNIDSISIPTNGLLPKKIQETVEEILVKNPGLEVGVHFSLDGLKKTHDRLRGVKGNFEKVVESVKRINLLKEKYPLLSVTINTVISNKNHQELSNLINFVKTLDVGSHTFDFLRSPIKSGTGLKLPPIREINEINKLRIKTRKHYLKNKGFWRRFFSLGKEDYLIKSQMRVLEGKRLPYKCLAGEVGAVIHHDGSFGLCEVLAPIGDLRKKNYNFRKIWESKKARLQRRAIKKHQCDCTHVCFLSMAIDHSPLVVFFKMPLNYLLEKWKAKSLWSLS
jgi:MoaA/NifB/PqqE/SkfB family radical SAM enzyme